MFHFLGDFYCKLDGKARLAIPSGLRQQLPDGGKGGLVVNRGFKKNLVIYTKAEWDKKVEELSKLNEYSARNQDFVRYFMRGATSLVPDESGRVLLSKALLDYAGIDIKESGEIVLSCQINKIEIWERKAYDALIANEPEDFAALAEEVMGGRRHDE